MLLRYLFWRSRISTQTSDLMLLMAAATVVHHQIRAKQIRLNVAGNSQYVVIICRGRIRVGDLVSRLERTAHLVIQDSAVLC